MFCTYCGALEVSEPSVLKRLGSHLILLYLRYVPLERGKWWLRREAASWLVARLDSGPWIRVTGVAELEWRVFLGHDNTEPETADAIARLLKPGHVFVDVGANIGYYSLSGAMSVGATGQVISFEPAPPAATRLRENAVLNRLSNLTVVEAAVADRPGTSELRLGEDSEGSSLFDVEARSNILVRVPVVTLDEYVRANAVSRVDLLKIDAEGAEVRVLRGARGLLSGPGAPTVIVEANPLTLQAGGDSIGSLGSELESFGYVVSVLEECTWRGVVVQNWLATKAG